MTACAGQPGCAKSRTDVRADAAAAIAENRIRPGAATAPASGLTARDLVVSGRQHWSGCDRRCGRPRGPVTDVIAEPGGYRHTPPGTTH